MRQELRAAAADLEAAEKAADGPSRIEFYRALNRIERGQALATDKILRELGLTGALLGLYALFASYYLYSGARDSEKLRRGMPR